MESINNLIRKGFVFSIDKGNLIYKYVGKSEVDKSVVMLQLADIQDNKAAAIDYVSSLIRLEVLVTQHTIDFYQVRYTIYNGMGNETLYQIAYYDSVPAIADYLNKTYINNSRFNWIYAKVNKKAFLFTFIGEDTGDKLDGKRQAAPSAFEQRYFMPIPQTDPLLAACPWQ